MGKVNGNKSSENSLGMILKGDWTPVVNSTSTDTDSLESSKMRSNQENKAIQDRATRDLIARPLRSSNSNWALTDDIPKNQTIESEQDSELALLGISKNPSTGDIFPTFTETFSDSDVVMKPHVNLHGADDGSPKQIVLLNTSTLLSLSYESRSPRQELLREVSTSSRDEGNNYQGNNKTFNPCALVTAPCEHMSHGNNQFNDTVIVPQDQGRDERRRERMLSKVDTPVNRQRNRVKIDDRDEASANSRQPQQHPLPNKTREGEKCTASSMTEQGLSKQGPDQTRDNSAAIREAIASSAKFTLNSPPPRFRVTFVDEPPEEHSFQGFLSGSCSSDTWDHEREKSLFLSESGSDEEYFGDLIEDDEPSFFEEIAVQNVSSFMNGLVMPPFSMATATQGGSSQAKGKRKKEERTILETMTDFLYCLPRL